MAVAQAQGRRRQMREVQAPVAEQSLREAEANLANARSLLRRNQELAEKGFISRAALGEFDRAVAVADSQVKSTHRQLESARPAGSDYALADTAVAEARASADLAGARAPIFLGGAVCLASAAFGALAGVGSLSASQLHFIDLIINYLTERGIIDPSLLYESPFTDVSDQGLSGVFPAERSAEVLEIVRRIRATAAA